MQATITKEDVFRAATTLAEQGIQPSIRLVRKELGNTGSPNTIQKHLNEWKELQTHQPTISTTHELLPEEFMSRVEAFATHVWSSAKEKADQRLQSERHALQQAREDFDIQMAEVLEASDELAEEVEQLRAQLQVAKRENEAFNERLQALDAEKREQEKVNIELGINIQHLRDTCERLETECIQLRADLRQQIEKANVLQDSIHNHVEKTTSLQTKLDTTIEQLGVKKDENAQLQDAIDRIREENIALKIKEGQQGAIIEQQSNRIGELAEEVEKQRDTLMGLVQKQDKRNNADKGKEQQGGRDDE